MTQQTDSELEDLKQVFIKERQARAEACWLEIQQAVKKHKCRLDAAPQFVGTGRAFLIEVEVRVIPLD